MCGELLLADWAAFNICFVCLRLSPAGRWQQQEYYFVPDAALHFGQVLQRQDPPLQLRQERTTPPPWGRPLWTSTPGLMTSRMARGLKITRSSAPVYLRAGQRHQQEVSGRLLSTSLRARGYSKLAEKLSEKVAALKSRKRDPSDSVHQHQKPRTDLVMR